MSTFQRIITSGIKGFFRNAWLSVATTLIIVLTLLIVSAVVVLNLITGVAADSVRSKIDVSLYFREEARDDEILAFRDRIVAMPSVRDVVFVSRNEALAEFRARHAGDELILNSLDALEENPLEASLSVRADDPEMLDELLAAIDQDPFAVAISRRDYDENQTVIERLTSVTNTLRRVGVVLITIFAAVSLIILFNTIGLTIYSRRSEIEIMKLVGATNMAIRLPFIVEGILYGAIAVAVSLIITYFAINSLSPRVSAFLQLPDFSLVKLFLINFLRIAGWELGIAVGLAIVGSWLAIRRYLKV